MSKKKKALILGLIALLLALLSVLLLPEEVVMQLRLDGEPGDVCTKAVAVLIPLIISGLGIGLYLTGEKDTKNFILVLAGYFVSLFALVVNLFVY